MIYIFHCLLMLIVSISERACFDRPNTAGRRQPDESQRWPKGRSLAGVEIPGVAWTLQTYIQNLAYSQTSARKAFKSIHSTVVKFVESH